MDMVNMIIILFVFFGPMLGIFAALIQVDSKRDSLDDSEWNVGNDVIEENAKQFVMNEDETIIAVLGTNYMEQYLKNELKIPMFCILTNCACYINRQEDIKYKNLRIEIQEIKKIKKKESFNSIWFLFSVVVLLIGIIFMLGDIPIFVLFWVLFFYGLTLFLKDRKPRLLIKSNKETFEFFETQYGKREMVNFREKIMELHEKVLMEKRLQDKKVYVEMVSQDTNKDISKIEELTKLSQLYEKNLINKEDFERLKNELLENSAIKNNK